MHTFIVDSRSCVFMLLYKEAYGDTSDGFINRTTTKMINGFVHLPWNLEREGSMLHGAMWEGRWCVRVCAHAGAAGGVWSVWCVVCSVWCAVFGVWCA